LADGPSPASVVVRVEGEDPFAVFEEPNVAAAQVAAFASMDACGDVICLAALFRPMTLRDATPGAAGRRHIYSFENQLGTHASLGGDQAYPFLLLPAHIPFDGSHIVTASQLYPVLRAIVDRQEPPARTGGERLVRTGSAKQAVGGAAQPKLE
jgi:hypothetical protein